MSDKNEHQDENVEKSEQAGTASEKPMSEDELLAAMGEEIAAEADAQEGSGFSNPLEALAAENTRQEEEIKDLKDKLLRTAAEMENLRRRTQKDVSDAREFSISKFARDILDVADNLRRAIDHVPDEEKDQPGLKSLIEGVEMTERELHAALEKNGVKKVFPEGEKFDPHFHQAMFEVENKDMPNNTVAQVVQTGYVIGDRVLRPAMVGVAKGGPKVSPVQDQPEEEKADAESGK